MTGSDGMGPGGKDYKSTNTDGLLNTERAAPSDSAMTAERLRAVAARYGDMTLVLHGDKVSIGAIVRAALDAQLERDTAITDGSDWIDELNKDIAALSAERTKLAADLARVEGSIAPERLETADDGQSVSVKLADLVKLKRRAEDTEDDVQRHLDGSAESARRIVELHGSLLAAEAKSARLEEELRYLAVQVQEWCNAVDRGTDWDSWDEHYKHLKHDHLPYLAKEFSLTLPEPSHEPAPATTIIIRSSQPSAPDTDFPKPVVQGEP